MTLMRGARASLWKILRGVALKGGNYSQTGCSFMATLQTSAATLVI